MKMFVFFKKYFFFLHSFPCSFIFDMWRIISDHKREISIVDSNTLHQSSDVLKDENNKWNVDFDMNKKQQSLLFVWTTELNEIKNKLVFLFFM